VSERAGPLWGRREFCALALASAVKAGAAADQVAIAYQALSGNVWPIFIAQEGGYYEKYGLAVKPVLSAYPSGVVMLRNDQATMLFGNLQQLLPAAAKDGSLVAIGSNMDRTSFSLLASKDITRVQDLKGKRIAVSQVGDTSYHSMVEVLKESGLSERDVNFIPVGASPSQRAAALASGRVEATLLFAPASFRMEEAGYRNVADVATFKNIFHTASYWVRRASISSNPSLFERLLQAHAEAIHRFYADKDFAVHAYLAHDKEAIAADIDRTHDLYSKLQLFERIPYVVQLAVAATLAQEPSAAKSQLSDFRTVVDNSLTDRLVKQGFFVKVFGAGVKAEQDEKAALAFR
jgi:ABC-type nitrate/sulfonate/bicarbonate transport system substrate-binding protein